MELPKAIMDKLCQKAGLDFEARPICVINACYLPDPAKFSYDLILNNLIKQLDEFVENDYVIVLFTAGGEHKPPVMWLYKAYKALSRKYKKNLKTMYIVHPNVWVKLLMDAMKAFISPKFAKKLVHCPTLSSLAAVIPYNQLQIPDAVLNHNIKLESLVTVPERSPAKSCMFGLSLDELMGKKNENGLPSVIVFCVAYLKAYGTETEGVFRRSPSSVQLKQARNMFDEGSRKISMKSFDTPVHISAVLIKLFLRELPSPLIPAALYPSLRITYSNSVSVSPKMIIQTLELLPLNSLTLLLYLVNFFHDLVSDAKKVEKTKMTSSNLGVVIGPNLVRCNDALEELEVARCASSFVKCCIDHYSSLLPSAKGLTLVEEAFNAINKEKEKSKDVLFQTDNMPEGTKERVVAK